MDSEIRNRKLPYLSFVVVCLIGALILVPNVQASVVYDSTWTTPTTGGATNAAPAVCWTVTGGTGRVDFVVRGTDNKLYHGYNDGSSHYWTSLGGYAASKPVIANASGYLYLFVIGSANRIYYQRMRYSDNAWSGWHQIPGAALAIAAVGALYSSSYTMYLIVRGTDNHVYISHQDAVASPSAFAAWYSLQGSTNDWPTVTVNRQSPGHLLIVVRGIDNKLYAAIYDLSGAWTVWIKLGGVALSAPALTSYYYSVDTEWRSMLVVRGSSNGIYYMYYYPSTCVDVACNNGWYVSWYPLNGATDKPPAVTADLQNSVNIFVRGTNGHLYARTSHENGATGSWYPWVDLGGGTSDDPVAAEHSTATSAIFYVRGLNNVIYQKWAGHT